jgi:hypothetical protein
MTSAQVGPNYFAPAWRWRWFEGDRYRRRARRGLHRAQVRGTRGHPMAKISAQILSGRTAKLQASAMCRAEAHDREPGHSGHPDACHRGKGTGRDGRRDGRPAAAAAQASPAQGRQSSGDWGEEPPMPPMPQGSAKSRTDSLWTCLTVRQFGKVAG